jgi:hypothetical protein
VVPGAADRFADNQPFRQRTVVMRADRTGGKDVLTLPDKYDWFVVKMAQ